MRNTGILLLLIGIYIIANSGSFRDLVRGKATLNLLNPTNPETTDTRTTFKQIGGNFAS